ncbi:zinc-ribbon domain [Dehalogenimonas alkenigignens]|uniref:Zinc-ribbon domain n=1 Tax=Dehalogenimonas alkenigignens TaxID=1217799 RepID=A0A0W0GI88_9CHLR|nr:zinc ribbon domain-containing protein [Dehalogenimonas alkenigignens]KTB48252.1 zinc-ribbon domain [Dehalogenimonas alkenigignens]
MTTVIKCGNCGEILYEGVRVCPKCGSSKKDYSVSAKSGISVSTDMKMKHKRVGKGTIHEEVNRHKKSADSKLTKGVREIITIDREKKPSTWDQTVTDAESGEITHEEHTTLKEHNESKKHRN